MKQLLNMARQKRQQQPRQFHQPSNLSKQQFSAIQNNYSDQEYEPDDQQIIAYAQYLGIKLPEQQHLLDIARQGLLADLPDEWANQQTDDGQIIYTNLRTGQRTMEHPCDQYYRQLVIKQRRKKEQMVNKVGGSKIGKGIGDIGYGININKGLQLEKPKKNMDPLVKMEMQKKKKKMEEQKKKEFQQKKMSIRKKYEDRKQNLQKQLREKLRKQKQKYDKQISEERGKIKKKLSEKQREDEENKRRQLQKYQREIRVKIDNKYQNIKNDEIGKIDRQLKNKKQQIRKNLQAQLKKQKKQIQQEFKQKINILKNKQKQSQPSINQQTRFSQQLTQLKKSIIDQKLIEYQTDFNHQRNKQQDIYKQKIQQLQKLHQQKVRELQTEGTRNPDNKDKTDRLMRQIQQKEKCEIRQFEYQLKILRQTKKSQNSRALENYKQMLNKNNEQKLILIKKQYENALEKHRQMKQQEYSMKISEIQKVSKESLLNHIRRIKERNSHQEQMMRMEAQQRKHKNTPFHNQTAKSVQMMQGILKKIEMKQKMINEEVMSIQQQIKKLSCNTKPFKYKLGEEFSQQYRILKDKILENDTYY